MPSFLVIGILARLFVRVAARSVGMAKRYGAPAARFMKRLGELLASGEVVREATA